MSRRRTYYGEQQRERLLRIWRAFLEQQSYAGAARVCGMSQQAVAKCLHEWSREGSGDVQLDAIMFVNADKVVTRVDQEAAELIRASKGAHFSPLGMKKFRFAIRLSKLIRPVVLRTTRDELKRFARHSREDEKWCEEMSRAAAK